MRRSFFRYPQSSCNITYPSQFASFICYVCLKTYDCHTVEQTTGAQVSNSWSWCPPQCWDCGHIQAQTLACSSVSAAHCHVAHPWHLHPAPTSHGSPPGLCPNSFQEGLRLHGVCALPGVGSELCVGFAHLTHTDDPTPVYFWKSHTPFCP